MLTRRDVLRLGVGTALWGAFSSRASSDVEQSEARYRCEPSPRQQLSSIARHPQAFSIIPVVGDGKWIWTRPPVGATGYLEPRPFDLKVGIELTGRGNAWQLLATTTVPCECPEQAIEQETIEALGCQAAIRSVGPYGRQLCLSAAQLAPGQTISATAHFRLRLYKQYHNYCADMFPAAQTVPPQVRKLYLGDSPGIQTSSRQVCTLAADLRRSASHPWHLVEKIAEWTRRNIRPQIGPYTSVVTALEDRRGDCEEMAALVVALCRAAGIPARLVWIPNHNWAEFYLTDREGHGRWIPVHTACYFWFGWTGVHELVLQKGDRYRVPERGRYFRLLEDWMQWGGNRPAVRYFAELTPLPPSPGTDPGPGARSKMPSGEWRLLGTHPLDRYARR